MVTAKVSMLAAKGDQQWKDGKDSINVSKPLDEVVGSLDTSKVSNGWEF
jgi:hypothetical protein